VPGPQAVQVVRQEVVIEHGRVVATRSKADELPPR
jgi:hypothetical protein